MGGSLAGQSVVSTALVLLGLGCSGPTELDYDGSRPDGTPASDANDDRRQTDSPEVVRDVDIDHDGDGDDETQLGPAAGPLTQIIERAYVLTDRLCDLDGDGIRDNSFADLGSPEGGLLAAAIESTMQGEIDSGDMRMGLHIPWVDDLRLLDDPDLVLMTFEARERETPDDASDDFSGEAPISPWYDSLDICGEPRFVFQSASLSRGQLLADGGSVVFPSSAKIGGEGAHGEGSIEPEGIDFSLCFYISIATAGGAEGVTLSSELTLQELLLGGWAIGMPTIPGIPPDIDVDGDGLERLVLDGMEIESCIDGDATSIPGADCWQDPRMADAFSLTVRLVGVGAIYAGPLPGLEDWYDEPCEDPPETSLFDSR